MSALCKSMAVVFLILAIVKMAYRLVRLAMPLSELRRVKKIDMGCKKQEEKSNNNHKT